MLLGIGVDYGIFVVQGVREEGGAGPGAASVAGAVATAAPDDGRRLRVARHHGLRRNPLDGDRRRDRRLSHGRRLAHAPSGPYGLPGGIVHAKKARGREGRQAITDWKYKGIW